MQIKEEQKKEEQKGEEVCYAEDDQTKEKSKKTEREGWAEKRRRYNEDVKRMKGHLTAKLNARQVTSSEAENEDNIFPINRKRMAAGEQTSNADLTVERGQGSRLGVRAIAQVTEDEEKPSASNPNVADDGLVYDLGTPTQDPFSPPTFENNSTTNMLSLIAKSTLEGLISQALEHLTITLTEDTNIRTAQGFQQSDSSSRASSSSSTTGTYPPNQSSPVHSTKRPLAPDRDPEDPDDDSDDDEPRRNKKGKGPVGREPHLGLRCPFYLRDPERYVKVQACSNGRGFANMARLRFVKQSHRPDLANAQ
jgi:hypothetical protein